MAERPREYPRQEAASASFADTARAGTEAVLQRLDTSPSDEGRAIALRQAGEIRACMDARCEAVGRRDPALASVSARLDEAIAEDRRAAIEAIRADASKFDSLPLDLRRDPDFRREAMRANMLVVRRWSYYEGATENEVRFVFAQTLRSPSLLAGMPPEIIERFFYTCRDQVTMQHFLVLDEWRASIVVGRLVAHGIYSFGSESAPVALADAIVLLRPKKLFSEPAAAAKLLNDTKLFHRAEGESMASFAERLRDAVPPAKWADVGYVLALLPLLDIPAKSFPFGVLATEVRDDPEARIWGDSAAMALIDMKMDGTGAEMEGRGKLLAALSGIKSLEQLRADPATVAAIAREPSLVRAMPLSSQTDVGVMAYLASRVPELASRRLMAPEILSDPRIVAACHEGARLDPAHDVGQLGYEQCSLRDMRELARVHGASVTSDLRFLERIESAMSQGTWDEFSQGKKDAKIVQPGEREAWREFYETTYSRERGFADAIRDIGWK